MWVIASATAADWVAAGAACATIAIYVVVAFFARDQIAEAQRARTQAAADAKASRDAQADLRAAEARPYVFLSFDLDDRPLIHLRLENLGKTAATNVNLSVDPPLTSSLDREDGMAAEFVSKEWYLPPGMSVRGMWDSGFARFGDDTVFPLRFVVTASYDGPAVDRHFDETFPLDLSSHKGMHWIGRKSFDDLTKALEKVAELMQSWDNHGHLDALVTDGPRFDEMLNAERERQVARIEEWRATQEAAAAAETGDQPVEDS